MVMCDFNLKINYLLKKQNLIISNLKLCFFQEQIELLGKIYFSAKNKNFKTILLVYLNCLIIIYFKLLNLS